MPDRTHFIHTPDNAFDLDYLSALSDRDETPTSFQATHGCAWSVVPLAGERFGLYRAWESPACGDEPFAVLDDRSAACLAATFLPLVARARSLWIHPDDDGDGYVLYREGRPVGRMSSRFDELTDALNLADALVRTPTSLASLLAAAGPEAMEQAGKILARGVLLPPEPSSRSGGVHRRA